MPTTRPPAERPIAQQSATEQALTQKLTIGRPRLLADPEKRRTISAMIATGAGFEAAARHVGCSVATIRNEMQRDETFAEEVRKSETGCQLLPLQALRNAAKTNWRAAAWLLERMHPEQFARKNHDAVGREEVLALVEEIGELVAKECLDEVAVDQVQQRLDQWRAERLGETPPVRPPHEPKSDLELFQLQFERQQNELLYGSPSRRQSK